MIALNHVLAGTAIGLAIKQPALIAPLAFLSHFVLDTTPHFNYKWPGLSFGQIWLMDAVASLSILVTLISLAPNMWLPIIIGGVAAELPDVLWIYERWILKAKSRNWFFVFHHRIQWSETQRGLLYEVGYLTIFVAANVVFLSKW